MASKLPEMCIAVSCSKNFGLYRERVGASIILVSDQNRRQIALDNLKSFNRLTFSFPPDFDNSFVDLISISGEIALTMSYIVNAAAETAVRASISTPVASLVFTKAIIFIESDRNSKSRSTKEILSW